MQITFLGIIILASVTLMITQVVRIELTALLMMVALAVTGILTPAEALSGFSSEATITVAAMLMLSAGLSKTGALDQLARLFGRIDVGKPRVFILGIAVAAAIPSAILNNTAVVIMLIPVVLRVCQRKGLAPSKFMIPLSYFAILGGTLTLIGTSTNILVHSLYRDAGGPGFGMFEFAPMGLCYLLLGGVVLFAFADKLLPNRKVLSQLLEPHDRKSFVTEITLLDDSRMTGRALGDLLTGLERIRILEIVRGEEVMLAPEMDTVIAVGDNLLIEGSARAIDKLLQKQGLDLGSAVADKERVKISRIDLLMVEAVVTPNSHFFNQRLSDVGLNRHYGIKVLAIQRMGRHLQMRLREMKLQVGDVLLVQGEESALAELESTGDVMLIEGVEKTLRKPAKVPLAVAILAASVALAAFGVLPLSVAALSGVAVMLLTGCLRMHEAISSLESSVLLLLAGTIPLGIAMQKTGMAEALARSVLHAADDFGPMALISALYLVTSLMTAFLTNNATAVLLTPIVLEIARETGIDPKPLLVAVTFGASASFFTPIGYQTNLLVMGPGGYKFRDYLKIGIIMNVILWIAATIMIPIFWPL